jgi:hypothetical protein
MAHLYFLAMILGFPLVILLLALFGGYLYRGRDAEILDWHPTRSPETEVRLHSSEIDQLLAAQNELRRRRGAPERSLEQATGRLWSA